LPKSGFGRILIETYNTNESLMLQEQFLTSLVQGHIPVTIYLMNGIKLQGEVISHDQYGLMLDGASRQFIFKHAISTIVPQRPLGDTHEPAPPPAAAPAEKRPLVLRPRRPRPLSPSE
jgi:host factor-I protein